MNLMIIWNTERHLRTDPRPAGKQRKVCRTHIRSNNQTRFSVVATVGPMPGLCQFVGKITRYDCYGSGAQACTPPGPFSCTGLKGGGSVSRSSKRWPRV